jgi:hypothetical protein
VFSSSPLNDWLRWYVDLLLPQSLRQLNGRVTLGLHSACQKLDIFCRRVPSAARPRQTEGPFSETDLPQTGRRRGRGNAPPLGSETPIAPFAPKGKRVTPGPGKPGHNKTYPNRNKICEALGKTWVVWFRRLADSAEERRRTMSADRCLTELE